METELIVGGILLIVGYGWAIAERLSKLTTWQWDNKFFEGLNEVLTEQGINADEIQRQARERAMKKVGK